MRNVSTASFTRNFAVAASLAAAAIAAIVLWAAGIGDATAADSRQSASATTGLRGVSLVNAPEVRLSGDDAKTFALLRAPETYSLGTLKQASDGVWFAAGPTDSCIFVRNTEGIGASCQTNDKVSAGKLTFVVQSTTDSASQVFGVVPDGVTSVLVRDARGLTVRTASVKNNAYRVSGEDLGDVELDGTATAIIAP